MLDNEVTEFDEEFLYAEYIDVILYNNNKELKDYLVQSRAGRSKALSRKQRVEIWKLTEKYEAIKQERKKMDRLELFNKTANYLKEKGVYPYTNVIVDEFQDFSNPELRFLRALVEDRENDLFLVGDPFQRVYNGRKINFTSAGINVKGKRSRKLKVNYRTTEEIKRIAVSVIKGEKYDDLDSGEENNKGYISLVHGEKPAYKVFETSDDEVKHVLEYIAQVEYVFAGKGISMNNVCIASRTKRGYKDIQDALHREGHKYGVLEGGDVRGDKNGVSLCTFHSLKGLEFRIVILVGVNEQMLPSREAATTEFERMDAAEKKEYLSHIRSLLYVAITRARQNVLITGYGEPTGLLEITK